MITSLACMTLQLAGFHASEALRPWTPQDSISVSYVDAYPSTPLLHHNRVGIGTERAATFPVMVSPDGEYFFFIVTRGDLRQDESVSEINVYRARDLAQRIKQRSRIPEPHRVEMRSRSSAHSAIEKAVWTADGRAILFLGMTADSIQELYALDANTGALRQISNRGQTILWFSGSGGAVIYETLKPERVPRTPYPGGWAELSAKGMLWGDSQREQFEPVSGAGYLVSDNSETRPLPLLGPRQRWSMESTWWSPNGRWVIALPTWKASPTLSDNRNPRTQVAPKLPFYLIDARSGEAFPLAIAAQAPAAYWAADSSRVTLVNAIIDDAISTADYDIASRTWTRATGTPPPAPQVPLAAGLSVRVDQGANLPPRVVASVGKQSVRLNAVDPILQVAAILPMTEVTWQEANGKTVAGGLILPRGFRKGQRVPLVIQAYYYVPEMFLPDGPHQAVDAAQALAARGMAVLQIDKINPERFGERVPEGPLFVARIDAAVEALARSGIVDSSKVGLTGFSRGGYQAYYAVTHPGKVRLAAAVAGDAYTGSFLAYLTTANPMYAEDHDELESFAGGSFWSNKAGWLAYEPTFNADRVVTPLLITTHSGGASEGELLGLSQPQRIEQIAAFSMNGKPLEYLHLPDASHQLIRPKERLLEMEAVIDWMAFWLQDYEDPSSAKALTYERWRPMRR